MAKVKYCEEHGGIGPFEYEGYHYYVAPASSRVEKKWGLYGTDTSLPNPITREPVDSQPAIDLNLGDHNTSVLTSPAYNEVTDGYGSIGAPAAIHCRSLGDDWYLPNVQELHHVIYRNKAAIDDVDTTAGASLAAIGNKWLWSSTEYNSGSAWIQRMSDGGLNGNGKYIETWVVAVKRVPISDKKEVNTTSTYGKYKEFTKAVEAFYSSQHICSLSDVTQSKIINILFKDIILKSK